MALNDDLVQQPEDQEGIENKKAESLVIHLFQAAMKKDVDAFKKALQIALNNVIAAENIYNASSRNGNSLIHLAAKFGNGEIVRAIADHEELRFLLTKRNSNGDTVLHMAVKSEDESPFNVLRELHDEYNAKYQQADVESADSTATGWKDVLLMASNNEGNTALHEALIHRRERMAENLMELVDRDVFFTANEDGKSALYLSVEAGYFGCVKHMLSNVPNNAATYEKLKEKTTKSVIHAAVQGNHIEISSLLIERLPNLKYVKDDQERSPLHVAASIGALQITRDLLKSRHGYGLDELDLSGMMPIHYAAKNNHVDVMKELLRHYHDPCELVTFDGKNILHVASGFGSYKAVRCILDSPELKMLLNQMDDEGNTPLHLASQKCRPRIVSALTWDNRVNVNAKNKNDQSALDVHGISSYASDQVFKQMLTWAALKAARTPEFQKKYGKGGDTFETFKDRVNTLLLVSTLVVTVTFAAGFTMPGAYNSSESPDDPGMAINLKHLTFQVFVISNTIAMYSAMLDVVVLMWAQLGDFRIMKASLQLALPLLGSALSMMCIAFMTGVYVTVTRLRWISKLILIFGCSFLAVIAGLIFLLGFPAASNKRCIRFVTYYLVLAMLWITGNLGESILEVDRADSTQIYSINSESSKLKNLNFES